MDNKVTVLVRFPNESYWDEMKIDLSKFKQENEFDHEVFGWYEDIYISIKKTSLPAQ